MSSLLLINSLIMFAVNIFFFILFEKSKPTAAEILPMVVICTAASLGRVIFAVIPQVQPVTALVIIFGYVYGCRKGYVAGALCAIISNMFLGQGPWTIFQMTAWGVCGLIGGVFGHVLGKLNPRIRLLIMTVYGFVSAYLFSFITDFLTICYIGEHVTFEAILAVYIAGFAFAIGHAVGNAIIIFMFFDILTKKLTRVLNKYEENQLKV